MRRRQGRKARANRRRARRMRRQRRSANRWRRRNARGPKKHGAKTHHRFHMRKEHTKTKTPHW